MQRLPRYSAGLFGLKSASALCGGEVHFTDGNINISGGEIRWNHAAATGTGGGGSGIYMSAKNYSNLIFSAYVTIWDNTVASTTTPYSQSYNVYKNNVCNISGRELVYTGGTAGGFYW